MHPNPNNITARQKVKLNRNLEVTNGGRILTPENTGHGIVLAILEYTGLAVVEYLDGFITLAPPDFLDPVGAPNGEGEGEDEDCPPIPAMVDDLTALTEADVAITALADTVRNVAYRIAGTAYAVHTANPGPLPTRFPAEDRARVADLLARADEAQRVVEAAMTALLAVAYDVHAAAAKVPGAGDMPPFLPRD